MTTEELFNVGQNCFMLDIELYNVDQRTVKRWPCLMSAKELFNVGHNCLMSAKELFNDLPNLICLLVKP